MHDHEFYMQRCLQLAAQGKGHVAPNPMVGCVIVHQGKVIGEGYHQRYGEAHAEVNAIHVVKDKSLLKEATIYVSLEPCAHFGKTPPCANLIVEHKIKRVVIGARDPHAKVDGKGISILEHAGIEVTTGVLEKECEAINKHFFCYHKKQRPYVLLKWAQSKNGFMDDHGKQVQISSEESKSYVHQLRHEYPAILVGKNTVLNDNPSLTVRAIEGVHPIRIVLDSRAELPSTSKLMADGGKTIVLNTVKGSTAGPVQYIQLSNMQPAAILDALYHLQINAVLIEGGAQVLTSFLKAGLWDEAIVFESEKLVEDGTIAPTMKQAPNNTRSYFNDILISYINA